MTAREKAIQAFGTPSVPWSPTSISHPGLAIFNEYMYTRYDLRLMPIRKKTFWRRAKDRVFKSNSPFFITCSSKLLNIGEASVTYKHWYSFIVTFITNIKQYINRVIKRHNAIIAFNKGL